MNQLRHNTKTMNACAIDQALLNKHLPSILADIIGDKVEALRDAYTDLGSSCISANPSFVLVNKAGSVLRMKDNGQGIGQDFISKATRFPCSNEAEIMAQVNSHWSPMSEICAAEVMLQSLTEQIHKYVDDLVDAGLTIKSIRDIQSRDYFGYEMELSA